KKMAILPASKDGDPNSRYMAYITQGKVDIQILPLDGNPHKSFAMICHSTSVSTLACSYDGRYAFTAGGQDSSAFHSFESSLSLEASAALEGKDMLPFYNILEGGRDGQLFLHLPNFILIIKQEVRHEDMQNEVKFIRYAETRIYVMDIDLEEYIKLYVNHRPASGISRQELCNAFQVLGKPDEGEKTLARIGTTCMFISGEHMTEDDLAECFTTLLGISAEGGSCTGMQKALPPEISMETFATDILGVSAATQELPQEHGHHL
uniref:WD repeat domain 66 n=1 Tax=Sinocyclocheilus rhinocerous TaxID=307959 RepID=A0A673L8F6_9TELE